MNGRAYDYNLGRFLSVDPIIQFPANSQSLNPYSYIMNNPLSGTDPTGYASCSDGGRNCDVIVINERQTQGQKDSARSRWANRKNGMSGSSTTNLGNDSNSGSSFNGSAENINSPSAKRTENDPNSWNSAEYIESIEKREEILRRANEELLNRLKIPGKFESIEQQREYTERLNKATIIEAGAIDKPGTLAETNFDEQIVTVYRDSFYRTVYKYSNGLTRGMQSDNGVIGKLTETLSHELRHLDPRNNALSTSAERIRATVSDKAYSRLKSEMDARIFERHFMSRNGVIRPGTYTDQP